MSQTFQSNLVLAAGLYNTGFAIFHLAFWRLFRWPESLTSSGRLNSAVTQTLNIVLTYSFLATGGAMIYLASKGHEPVLLMLAGAGFWTLRAALQPILFPRSSTLSGAMTLIFIVGAVIHASPLVTI